MTLPSVDEIEDGSRKGNTGEETSEGGDQNVRIMTYTIVTIVAGSIATLAAGFLVAAYQQGNRNMMIYCGLTVWIFTGLIVAATLLKEAPPGDGAKRDPNGDAAARALAQLTAQNDAALRPYLGVSGVTATMKIAEPVSVVIKFTNNGNTPAEEAEIRGRLEKLQVGTPLERHYDGAGFERVSKMSINRGNTVEAEFVSRDENTVQLLTVDDVMQLNTDKSHYLAAHGVVRYRSKHIPGGSDETPFCYEFEPVSSQWIACRVPADEKNIK